MVEVLEAVAATHHRTIRATGFPSRVSVGFLKQQLDRCRVLPSLETPRLFFVLDSSLELPGLDYPLVRFLTPLKPLQKSDLQVFVSSLAAHAPRHLAIVASYLSASCSFVRSIAPSPTYYDNVKLLCDVRRIRPAVRVLPANTRVRSFRTGQDEDNYVKAYNDFLGYLGSKIARPFIEGLEKRGSFNPEGYLFAESAGRTIGFVSLENEPQGTRDSKFAYIYQIGVASDYRGTGVADVLLDRVITFAQAAGIERVGVGVRRSNQTAIKFFKRRGFEAKYSVVGHVVDVQNPTKSLT